MCVSRVFDDHQVVPPRDIQERIHVGCLSGEMHGDDGLGSRGDGLFHSAGSDVEGISLDVREDGDRINHQHCTGGGDKRIRWHDDFISGPHAKRLQHHLEGSRAVGTRNAVPCTLESREGLLKLRHLRAGLARFGRLQFRGFPLVIPITATQHFEQGLLLVFVKGRPGGKRLGPLGRPSKDRQSTH